MGCPWEDSPRAKGSHCREAAGPRRARGQSVGLDAPEEGGGLEASQDRAGQTAMIV